MLSISFSLQEYLWGMLTEHVELWLLLFPMFVLVELPLLILVMIGIFRWGFNRKDIVLTTYPSVSIIITCYSEGETIGITIDTLAEQLYPGNIEILAVVDGASQNIATYTAAMAGAKRYANLPNRDVRVIPKWQRGGRVSTLNAGLDKSSHEFVFNVDGDTSFDNDMVSNMIYQFETPEIIASGGALRVRNSTTNLLTRMQSIEYMVAMQAAKTGMANFGVLNNISGAFGAFRKTILKQVGGWDTHTAEDLDLTMRLKQYKRRYPLTRLGFTPHAVGHTDVPHTIKGFMSQRLRWDGDLFFLFMRKHKKGITPKLMGWGNFIFTLAYSVIQNILLPFLVLGYTIFLSFNFPSAWVAALFILLYTLYFSLELLCFIVYLGLVSEKPMQDIKMTIWLPLYPFYQFFTILLSAFAVLNEIVRRGHEESTMAPWWVLKRGKRF
jgi:cellulose synthase/poly-beta-1,6-N-acetylglucosamine synthase-like glycosyltransferase